MLFNMKFRIDSLNYCAKIRLTLSLESRIVIRILTIPLNFPLIIRIIIRFFIGPDLPRNQKTILKHSLRWENFLLHLIINIQNPWAFPHGHQISKCAPIITNLLLLAHELNNCIFLFQTQIDLAHIFTFKFMYFVKYLLVWYLFCTGHRH